MSEQPKGLRILSFDGGGIRGISGLLIILEIMSRIAYDLGLNTSLRPRDYFEMAGGSGTGALNAILLGRLGFTVEEAIEHYTRIAEVAFSIIEISSDLRIEKLKKVVEEVVKAAGLEPEAKMEDTDTQGSNCKTVVFTASVENPSSTRLLRSYPARSFRQPNCTIVDAILASLSIPGVLNPVKLGTTRVTEDFMEASLSCNNPTMELLREAEAVYRKKFKLSSLISIGCGRAAVSVINTRDGLSGEILKSMVPMDSHIALSCERTHEEVRQRTDYTGAYYRFDTGRDLDPALILEWQQVPLVQTHTTKYLQGSDVNDQIDEVVELLQDPKEGIAFSMKPKEAVRLAVDEQMKSQLEPSLDTNVLIQQKSAAAEGTLHDKCLDGTRVAILQLIREWANLNAPNKPIFWLCDSAGTGKSTVAATMSHEWGKDKRLAGRFFFNSSDSSASSTNLFCSTLALDIASRVPKLRSRIAAVFKEDLLISRRDFSEQFNKLIVEPLRELDHDLIIVIDAIDECDAPSRKTLLSLLVEQLPSIPRLKIFITSRPEDDIFPVLKASSIVRGMEFQLQTTTIRSNVEDIQTYIDFHLGEVLSETDRLLLVEKAGGLFIWASTAKRELDPGSSILPNNTIFKRLVSSQVSRDLNSLYSGILQRAFPNTESIEFGCQVLGIFVASQEPISTITLTRFMSGESVKKLVDSLRSVLNYTNDDDPIQFFHPTFREYLLMCKKEPFLINIEKSHFSLAKECISIMQEELRENICDIPHSNGIYPYNKDIPNRVNDVILSTSDALRYSIIHWLVHTKSSIDNPEIFNPAISFFQTNLLHWIEVLSLSNQIQAGLTGLNAMKNLGRSQQSHPAYLELLDWCNDVFRFIQNQLADIEWSASYVYSTVLSSAPRRSLTYLTYGPNLERHHLRFLAGKPSGWPSHEILSGHTDIVLSVSLHGDTIVSASLDKTLCFWSSSSGTRIGSPLTGHTEGIDCVSFSPDGTRVVSGSRDKTLILWDSVTRKPLREPLEGHSESITDVAFSPDGTRLVSASRDDTLRLWDLCSSQIIPLVLSGHSGIVSSVVFSSDGAVITSASTDGTVRMWNGITGEVIGAMMSRPSGKLICVVLSPDGKLLASGSNDKLVAMWDVETQKYTGEPFRGHTALISCLAFSPDGTRIISGSNDTFIRIWDVATGECIAQLNGHTRSVLCVAFLPGETRVVSGSFDYSIRIWDLDGPQDVVERSSGHSKTITGIAFSPCGTKVATSSEDCTLKLWDTSTGDFIGEMKGHEDEVTSLAFSPDGQTIASGSRDKTLRLWDVESQSCSKIVNGHTLMVTCVAFSHNGSRIISGASEGQLGELRLWDSASGTGSTFGDHSYGIGNIVFSPDDTMVVPGARYTTLRLWSIPDEQLRVYEHDNYIFSTTFSTDNLHILLASFTDIAIWNISSSQIIARHPFDPFPIPPHVQTLEFDLDMTLSLDGYIYFSPMIENTRRHYPDQHYPQLYYEWKTHSISSLHSSDYAFPLPLDFPAKKWRSRNRTLVVGGGDGRVMILSSNHLFIT